MVGLMDNSEVIAGVGGGWGGVGVGWEVGGERGSGRGYRMDKW